MLPSVTVSTGASGPGAFPAIEGVALFIGAVTSGDGALEAIGLNTDLAAKFGAALNLADTIAEARNNGGPGWQAHAIGHAEAVINPDAAAVVDKTGGKTGFPATAHGIPAGESVTLAGFAEGTYNATFTVDPDSTADEIVLVVGYVAEALTGDETITWNQDWQTVIAAALAGCEPEMIVVCKPVTAGAELTAMNTKATALLNLSRRLFFLAAYGADPSAVTWSSYLSAAQAVTAGLDLGRVMISPLLFGAELGAFAGRLAKEKVARSPVRTKSGSVVSPGAKPADIAGIELDKATLEALNTARYSVFTWYEGLEGIYFADALMLEATGGDFPVAEWLRVTDKAARQVRIVAIKAIGDDDVENTPGGNAAFGTRLSSPLRTMASVGVREIKPLAKNAISVVWTSITAVQLYMTIQPLNAPKAITVGITLDTSNN